MENWLGSSLNQIQGWYTVQESYSRALEQGPLFIAPANTHTHTHTHTPSLAETPFAKLNGFNLFALEEIGVNFNFNMTRYRARQKFDS